MMNHESPQKDRFVHDRLPAGDQWPVFLPHADVPMSGSMNCVEVLLDNNLQAGRADRPAIINDHRTWSYRQLADRVNQVAHKLMNEYAVEPGNRVLIRGVNSPEVAAIWLAVQKIGAVAVTSMSLLRSAELQVILDISRPVLAICELNLEDELSEAIATSEEPLRVLVFTQGGDELFDLTLGESPDVAMCATLADDISLIAFTSGTTGRPKAAVHFHRDILAICHTVCRHMIDGDERDIFIGTAPLAFTFGLGGLLVFPLFCGAATVLHGRYDPTEFVDTIERHKATICFTVPTYYQQVLKLDRGNRLQSLRLSVSSGEALPLSVRETWTRETGIEMIELLGSTEMLHAFAGAGGENIRPGFIGPAIEGFELAILDDEGCQLPPGETGCLAVRGPIGCRYLNDERQTTYVQCGWNITGDVCLITADGYLAYHSRYDDMIITSGYNVSGLEVENAILEHPQVTECAVIGVADEARGQIVVAYVVVLPNVKADREFKHALQMHVKARIAPYKYPRKIYFVDALPRNESGKIQRFRLGGEG